MYVARYTDTPEGDIKRGWSGFMGMAWDTLREALEDVANVELDDLDDLHQDWIEKWGDYYEDYANFEEHYFEEIAEDHSITFDEIMQQYRVKHHDGLSCWLIDADTIEGAMTEAKAKHDAKEIDWAGFGYATVGNVKLIGAVQDVENLYIFECDDAEIEV